MVVGDRATVTSAFSIKGLASADFMVHGQSAMLLEINPRPGATLDIFDSAAAPLLGLHLDAVMHGKLPRARSNSTDAMASAIVFAPSAEFRCPSP